MICNRAVFDIYRKHSISSICILWVTLDNRINNTFCLIKVKTIKFCFSLRVSSLSYLRTCDLLKPELISLNQIGIWRLPLY